MKLLYFSTVNWNWIKQRPHFISFYLSKNNVEVDFLSLTPFLKQNINRGKNDNINLNIKDIYVIPFANKVKLIEKINILFVKNIINKKRYDYIVLTHPFQIKYISNEMKKNSKIIYECMDNMPYFYENSLRNRVILYEDKLCKDANGIITSSAYLKERLVKDYNIDEKRINIIKNAVDNSFLDNKIDFKLELNHPNVMYIGTISSWFDFETINKFAEKNPQVTIYLVGPTENRAISKINKQENIKIIGKVDYNLVKSYIYHADVMMIPFVNNDIIQGVDPVKAYEYMALNKKVISSYWKEIDCYKNQFLFYRNYDTFNKGFYDLLDAKKIDKKNILNKSFIEKNNWQARVYDYLKFLRSIN